MAILERKQLSARIHQWTSERGGLRVEIPRAHILIFRPSGHLEAAFVELFQQVVDESVSEGRPHLFWDGEAMTGYDSDFRKRIGEYCVAVKSRVASMNVYTPSPLVAMGAAVINIWLGGFFRVVKTRDELEAIMGNIR